MSVTPRPRSTIRSLRNSLRRARQITALVGVVSALVGGLIGHYFGRGRIEPAAKQAIELHQMGVERAATWAALNHDRDYKLTNKEIKKLDSFARERDIDPARVVEAAHGFSKGLPLTKSVLEQVFSNLNDRVEGGRWSTERHRESLINRRDLAYLGLSDNDVANALRKINSRRFEAPTWFRYSLTRGYTERDRRSLGNLLK